MKRVLVHVGLALAALTPGEVPARAQSIEPMQRGPIRVEAFERTLESGVTRGFVARVDLRDPRVEIVVTSGLEASAERPSGAEASLMPTDRWAERAGVVLAINANFFGLVKDEKKEAPAGPAGPPKAEPPKAEPPKADAPKGKYTAGNWSDILGLSISGGVIVSPPRLFHEKPDPALLILPDGVARIAYVGEADARGAYAAVAGIGGGSDDTPGTLLVEHGKNLGSTARVQPDKRHPRTAAGVSADGRTLILAVVDGRRANWSVGMTLPELADLMMSLGAADAINLDGGGSSSFVFVGEHGKRLENKPSDGSFRPVANHLGVRLKKEADAEKK